jgi:hypothetical protein
MSEVDPSKPVALEHQSESGTYALDSRRSLLDMSATDGRYHPGRQTIVMTYMRTLGYITSYYTGIKHAVHHSLRSQRPDE